jgi:hypothetical protein
VAAIGGAAALDAVTTYQSTLSQPMPTPQGDQPSAVTVQWIRDDHARIEFRNGPITLLAATRPDGGFTAASQGSRRLIAQQMLIAQRQFYLRILRYQHDNLGVLLAARRPDFQAAAASAPTGDASGLEHVAVRFADAAMTIGIDPRSGLVRSLTFAGRTSHGDVGTRTLLFDDFRDVHGLKLAHKVDGRFDGRPDPEWTWTVTSIRLNETIDPALFHDRN